jgi:hypothetical protein
VTAPPWGHKPRPAFRGFSTTPPPGLSARCLYWLRRADDGNWRVNRRFWEQSDEGRADLLGVHAWEVKNVLVPFLANLKEDSSSHCSRALGHDINNCCVSCHADWEYEGTYMCDGYDVRARDLHTCCKASTTSLDLIQRMPWDVRMEARRR